jgi:hypothetical protein
VLIVPNLLQFLCKSINVPSFGDLNPTFRYNTVHLQQVDKTMETLTNCRTEFVCIGYNEITSTDNNKCSCLFTLCCASVSALKAVLSNGQCERRGKLEIHQSLR